MRHLSFTIIVFVCFLNNAYSQSITIDTSAFRPFDTSLPLSILNSYSNSYNDAIRQFDHYYNLAKKYIKEGDLESAKMYVNRCIQLNNRYDGGICDRSILINLKKACEQNSNSNYYPQHQSDNLSIKSIADKGDSKAQFLLGLKYYEGKDVEKNHIQAFYWIEKAASNNYADAQFFLGNMYYEGIGCEKDYKKTLLWYEKAAENGHSHAQYCVGYLYELGIGTSINNSKAAYWYKKAALGGNLVAQYKYGLALFSGKGIEKDKEQGCHWIEETANSGLKEAQYTMGIFYLTGESVKKILKKPFYYYPNQQNRV